MGGVDDMCVHSVRYSLQVNDDVVGPIIPGWGLRQGDPLPPYLFILYTEGLSVALNQASIASVIYDNIVMSFCH